MAALEKGTQAPEIQLSSTDGKGFSLNTAREQSPVVAAFFKISCPVCQFTFPYLERIYQAYKGKGAAIVGVSQDSKADTDAFARQYGITFPILLDDPKRYPVSNAYGITNVPTTFEISKSGAIDLSSVGWSKSDIEELNHKVAQSAGVPPAALFKPGENVPEFKAG